MAKVTYEFDYYEDRDLIGRHAAVGAAFAFIENLDQDLRSLLKYGKGGGWDESTTGTQIADDIRNRLFETGLLEL